MVQFPELIMMTNIQVSRKGVQTVFIMHVYLIRILKAFSYSKNLKSEVASSPVQPNKYWSQKIGFYAKFGNGGFLNVQKFYQSYLGFAQLQVQC